MTLVVHTARISTRDPDRFDITRKSGGEAGEPFAPSWAILGPALAARRRATELQGMGTWEEHAEGLALEARSWERYVVAYTDEMRATYRSQHAAWDALLARPRVVLVCYCTDPARCHRTLLAGILGKLGADVRGELPR